MASTARSLSSPASVRVDASPEPGVKAHRLWLCAHFSALALEVLNFDPTHPAATVEDRKGRSCLHAVSELARHSGVEAGMALAAAYALCPDLTVRSRDAEAERKALIRLAQIGLEFTPWVSLDQPESLLLEIRTSLNLFGGVESLQESLRRRLLAQGHRPAMAISPSPETSALLARLGVETIVLERQTVPSVLRQVPVEALPLNEQAKRRMARTGLHVLGDLWRLPRDGLARRYGAQVLRCLDSLAGMETRAVSSFHSPPRFSARRDMPIELERLDHFFPAIAQLAGEFTAFLKSRDAAASGLTLDLHHPSRAATRIELSFRSDNRDTGHWLLLLREKLDRSPLPAPVLAVTLQSRGIVPFEPDRSDLFGDTGTGFADGKRNGQAALEQLQARLGPHALKRLHISADHRPERAVPEDPAQNPDLPNRLPDLPLRPLWLLSTPEPLEARGVRLLSEPERIESGWWDGAPICRDYHVAGDWRGRKLWIFRDLNGAGRWYLHGLFG